MEENTNAVQNTEEQKENETKTAESNENVVSIKKGSHKKHEGDGVNKNPILRKAPAMEDETYIRERLDSQMIWYDTKSTYNQKKYKSLKTWEIIISASIPVLIAISSMGFCESATIWTKELVVEGVKQTQVYLSLSTILQIIAAVGGVFMVVLNKLFELEGYYDNWKKYRVTAEELRQERIKYLTHTDPYDEADAFPVLVANIEGILNKENMTWQQTMSKVKTAGLRNKAQKSIDEVFEGQKKREKPQQEQEPEQESEKTT